MKSNYINSISEYRFRLDIDGWHQMCDINGGGGGDQVLDLEELHLLQYFSMSRCYII
jgi:hypothetical protein